MSEADTYYGTETSNRPGAIGMWMAIVALVALLLVIAAGAVTLDKGDYSGFDGLAVALGFFAVGCLTALMSLVATIISLVGLGREPKTPAVIGTIVGILGWLPVVAILLIAVIG